MTEDLVTLIDENDQVIGQMDKVEAHRGDGKLHRAISVYLFCKKENKWQLLLQQRSQTKIVGALEWSNTICANVWPSEDYPQCADRRLKEEMGIVTKLEPIYKFRYQVKCNDQFSENEIDQVFFGVYDGQVLPNPEEANDYAWVDWDILHQAIAQGEKNKFGGVETKMKIREDEQAVRLTPWFMWMMRDEKLMDRINQNLV